MLQKSSAAMQVTKDVWVAALTALLLLPCFLLAEARNPVPPAAGNAEISGLEKLYRGRALRNPQDWVAFEGMAILETRRGDYADAIAAYQHVLELSPRDFDAQMGLARALAYSGRYDDARQNFQRILEAHPGDADVLEALGLINFWSGQTKAALSIFQGLTSRYPADLEFAQELARVEMRIGGYAEARKSLTQILSADPGNREAELQFARLDLAEGREQDTLRRYNHLLAQDPTDREALGGNARVAYYRGDLKYAHDLAAKLVQDDSGDVPALLLLAHIERAVHNPAKARELVARVETLDTGNTEARELRTGLDQDSRLTWHTAASYSREISASNLGGGEDLRSFGYETTWGLPSLLRRSESNLSLYYLPSNSPSGGIRGAAGPSEFLYRQTTYLTPTMTGRGGAGLARFGPGDLAGIPTQDAPIESARTRPVGFINVSYLVHPKLTAEFTESFSALAYTPTAARLGVRETRTTAGVHYRFNARTQLHLESFATNVSSIAYDHVLVENGLTEAVIHEADHKQGHGGALTFDRVVFGKPTLALDLGYSGLVYGFRGGQQQFYMGFFTPGFYQRHYLTAHLSGRLRGPLGFDFSSGTGVQQVERGESLDSAWLVNPALTLKTGSRLEWSLGYAYYNSSQSLGTLTGNSVRLTTDWKF